MWKMGSATIFDLISSLSWENRRTNVENGVMWKMGSATIFLVMHLVISWCKMK